MTLFITFVILDRRFSPTKILSSNGCLINGFHNNGTRDRDGNGCWSRASDVPSIERCCSPVHKNVTFSEKVEINEIERNDDIETPTTEGTSGQNNNDGNDDGGGEEGFRGFFGLKKSSSGGCKRYSNSATPQYEHVLLACFRFVFKHIISILK